METTSELKKQLEASQKKLAEMEEKDRLKHQESMEGRGKKSSHSKDDKNVRAKHLSEILSKASDSELTIYRNAVENQISKRDSSSSSDDCLNSSDETVKIVEGI